MPLYDKTAYLTVRADTVLEAESCLRAVDGIALHATASIDGRPIVVEMTLALDESPVEELED